MLPRQEAFAVCEFLWYLQLGLSGAAHNSLAPFELAARVFEDSEES